VNWLSDKEVADLTRKKRPSAQIRVLRDGGIQFRVVDGRPIVPRSEIEQTRPDTFQPQLRLAR
jgi:hypothetical protein